jgi:hypothetical protein
MIHPRLNPFWLKLIAQFLDPFWQVRSASVGSCAHWQRLMRSASPHAERKAGELEAGGD